MYFCLSFTHKNTALNLRERLALDDSRKAELFKLILASAKIDECVLLSTCNRTEILCALGAEDGCVGVREYLLKCLSLVCAIDLSLIENAPDIYEDSGFIHHLFTVASSLDSLVIGETQITGQLRAALAYAAERSDVARLSIALQCAFKCAASVRNQTDISKHRLSISSVAVQHSREHARTGARALIIGSGEMARLCAKALAQPVDVISRNFEHAKALCEQLNNGSRAIGWDALRAALHERALVFSATSAAQPVLHEEDFIAAAALSDEAARLQIEQNCAVIGASTNFAKTPDFPNYQPDGASTNFSKTANFPKSCEQPDCMVYDIAVPRDTSFSHSTSVQVVCVDDLQTIVATNMALKEEQAKIAYKIISAKVREFFAQEKELAAAPIIKAMRASSAAAIDEQLQIALKKGYLPGCDAARVKRFAQQLMQAYLHAPTVRLKHADGYELDVLHYIFDTKESDEI